MQGRSMTRRFWSVSAVLQSVRDRAIAEARVDAIADAASPAVVEDVAAEAE
jgi:hypothetical protein